MRLLFIHTRSLLLALLLLLIPGLVWLERTHPQLLSQRLYLPDFFPVVDKHTPRHATGTLLPPTITTPLTLGPEHHPIILTGTTTIEPGGHLTLLPGSALYAHEFSTLIIHGQLSFTGTKDAAILLTTNELHSLNQVWNGLIFTPSAKAQITHTTLQYAYPGFTCEPNSSASLSNLFIEYTNLAGFIASSNCSLANSRLRSFRDGLTIINAQPALENNIFHVKRDEIRRFR
jgi:hypothetical protein